MKCPTLFGGGLKLLALEADDCNVETSFYSSCPVYLDPFLYTSVWQTINQGTQHFRISKKECIQISSFVLLQLY